MSLLIDLGQGLELRDASGRTLGFFTPEQVVKELTAECADLRKRLAAVEAERDTYLQAVHAFLKEDFRFTPEELAQLQATGVPLERVIGEIEASFQERNHA